MLRSGCAHKNSWVSADLTIGDGFLLLLLLQLLGHHLKPFFLIWLRVGVLTKEVVVNVSLKAAGAKTLLDVFITRDDGHPASAPILDPVSTIGGAAVVTLVAVGALSTNSFCLADCTWLHAALRRLVFAVEKQRYVVTVLFFIVG
jgi:hypothetical protein